MLATSRNKVLNEVIYLALLTAALVGSTVWWSQRLDKNSESVVYRSDAGIAIAATYSVSSFGAYVTRIETTIATYQVQGTLAINEGERLTLEVRKSGDKKLCKVSSKDCRNLTD